FTRSLSRRRFLGEASRLAATLALSPGFARGSGAVDSAHAFAELEVELDGDLLLPSNSRYDELRRVASFNPLTDEHPAAIARCASQADVARSVVFASERGLEIAVHSGGHDILGGSVCDGGLMIDLSAMKTIQVDSRARSLRCGPGLRAGEVERATQPFGLAAALGCNPVVGISGLTLGGGIGWFAGKYGATCDSLIRAEVVGADGQIRRASRDENPDLFWALQGGGGNFGIVSSLEYRLHPVTQVLGGLLAYPIGQLGDVLRVYRDLLAGSPDELTVEISIQTLAEPLIMAVFCHSGDPVAGERVIGPLRRLAPVGDSIGLVDYARLTERPGVGFALQSMGLLGTLEMIPRSFGAPPAYGHWRGASLSKLDEAAIDDFAAAIAGAPRQWSIGIGHYMHGAICRRPAEETPLLRPPGRFTFFFSAAWWEPHEAEGAMSWVDTSWQSLATRGSAGGYVNYLSDGSPSAVRRAYGEHYTRLARIKRVYDPDNVFHRNRNILAAS
ncbi:MAG: FAD-binding oxidoreductase, partial [Myxococcota bacterium]